MFEIKDRDAAGRICSFTTRHGTVTTPALLPVINPNQLLIHPKEMEKFGAQMLMTNSYIINENEEMRNEALKKGIHSLLDFHGPVMTDSGAFQSYLYGIKIDPIKIVEFQRDIGSDVGSILDVLTPPDASYEEAKNGIEETLGRARKSIEVKGEMCLACPIQGSIYPDLRKKCAQEMSELDAGFHPIGGVVPLMEGQYYKELAEVIIASKKGLTPARPVHLFGAGHPLIFPLAVALGCDFFDSSAYIKYAKDDRLIFPDSTRHLDEIDELPCCCPICEKYGTEIKEMPEEERIKKIAEHNLYISFAEMKKVREAIREKRLWELVELRSRANPHLMDAMNLLKRERKWLEKWEPISKKNFFYTGRHSINRPIIYRYHKRLFERYALLDSLDSPTILFKEGKKPYSRYYAKEIREISTKGRANLIVSSSLGPVPMELDEMFPFSQSILPKEVDHETKEMVREIEKKFLRSYTSIKWEGENTLKKIPSGSFDFDISKIKAVADMQFGKGAGDAFREIKIKKSKKTGKIRNVFCNGKHVLSMRASDGFFTLKFAGGKRLHKKFHPPKLRVFVKDEAIPFIAEGKSVFCKFVMDCDDRLRPFDECLIVDKNDDLIAVGQCLLNREEMLSFERGVAVKTRESR